MFGLLNGTTMEFPVCAVVIAGLTFEYTTLRDGRRLPEGCMLGLLKGMTIGYIVCAVVTARLTFEDVISGDVRRSTGGNSLGLLKGMHTESLVRNVVTEDDKRHCCFLTSSTFTGLTFGEAALTKGCRLSGLLKGATMGFPVCTVAIEEGKR